MVIILGIETSCDECAAAVVENGRTVLSQVVASQVQIHAKYRGVVPEIASRRHLESILPVIREALERSGVELRDIDALAVTHRPGLIGALLVGLSAAKGLALATNLPLVAVHHIEAHVYAALMEVEQPRFPLLALVVSGGHTSLYRLESPLQLECVGSTLDDAAGEAFDKVAAILGLPYPGGPAIEKAALQGNAEKVPLPRSYPGRKGFDFSFSGMKTAVLYHCRGVPGRRRPAEAFDPLDPQNRSDVAASFEAAVVDVLVNRSFQALEGTGAAALAVGGGVSANKRLRTAMTAEAERRKVPLYLPPLELTTDNAVMVAGMGYPLYLAGRISGLDLDASPR